MINELSICIIPAHLCILRNLISIQDEILFVHPAECLSVEFLLCPDNAEHLTGWQYCQEACMIFLLQLLQLDVYLILSADCLFTRLVILRIDVSGTAHLIEKHTHLLAHLSIHGEESGSLSRRQGSFLPF